MELFIYLLKVAGCTAVFYILYYLLFRRLTFFTINRWYLLSALAVSLVIPAIHIQIQKRVVVQTATQQSVPSINSPNAETDVPVILKPKSTTINWTYIATIAYATITLLLILKLLINICTILFKAFKKGKRHRGYYLITGSLQHNSSFFNYIFLKDDGLHQDEQEQVINHELTHAKLLHSVDNLFIEILKAAFWFNPFIYLFARALHQVHEFEVDQRISCQYDAKAYAGLLLRLSLPNAVGITNQFSAYGLKGRVHMIFTTRSAAAKKVMYLLAAPLLATLFYYLAVEQVYAFDEVKGFTIILDAGHGGTNNGASAMGFHEKDINLQLVKEIEAVAHQRGIKTVLTRHNDQYVSLKERVIPKGDVFVSVHINYMPLSTDADQNGIRVLIQRNKPADSPSRKLAHTFVEHLKELHGISTADTIADNQGIYVLRNNTAPAVLLSVGFMSNKNDLKYITNKQNQHDIAVKFVDALIDYKKENVNVRSARILHQAEGDTGKNKKGLIDLLHIKSVKNIARADTPILPITFNIIHSDKTLYSRETKSIHLTRATIQYDQSLIKADDIKYNGIDSTIIASGNVELTNYPFNANRIETVRTDSLVMNLRSIDWHALKPHVFIKSASKG